MASVDGLPFRGRRHHPLLLAETSFVLDALHPSPEETVQLGLAWVGGYWESLRRQGILRPLQHSDQKSLNQVAELLGSSFPNPPTYSVAQTFSAAIFAMLPSF